MKKNLRHRGLSLTEVIICIGLLTLMLACVGMTLGAFRGINHYHHNRLRCTAAAQAQLNNIAVTGGPIDEQVFNGLWPRINISIEKSAGKSQWCGLTLVTVTAGTGSPISDVEIKLARYIAEAEDN